MLLSKKSIFTFEAVVYNQLRRNITIACLRVKWINAKIIYVQQRRSVRKQLPPRWVLHPIPRRRCHTLVQSWPLVEQGQRSSQPTRRRRSQQNCPKSLPRVTAPLSCSPLTQHRWTSNRSQCKPRPLPSCRPRPRLPTRPTSSSSSP